MKNVGLKLFEAIVGVIFVCSISCCLCYAFNNQDDNDGCVSATEYINLDYDIYNEQLTQTTENQDLYLDYYSYYESEYRNVYENYKTNNKDITVHEFVYYDIPLTREQQDIVFLYADAYDVDEKLILSIMYCESNYDIDLVCGKDKGIMQINSVALKEYGEYLNIDNVLDYEQNVRIGSYIIAMHIHNFSTIHMALMAYNGGAGYALSMREQGYTSSRYSRKVMEYYESIVILDGE